jgi:hypothetical protein
MIMKKQLAIAASVLLTLSTAVATTLNDGPTTKPAVVEVTTQVVSKESAQAVLLFKAHASSSGSVPLARPL